MNKNFVATGLAVLASIGLSACVSPTVQIAVEPEAKERFLNLVPENDGIGSASCYGHNRAYVVRGKQYWIQPVPIGYVEEGLASWYGKYFQGRRTASGEYFDIGQLTAAHKTLPMFSEVQVTNLHNGKAVKVRINDRGPFIGERIIDLSYSAAKALDMIEAGVVPVSVKVAKVPYRNSLEGPLAMDADLQTDGLHQAAKRAAEYDLRQ